MDKKHLLSTIKQICEEKNITIESVIETIEAALAAAYRKDFGNKLQNIKVDFDIQTGDSRVFDVKTVVEDLPEEELLALQSEQAELESFDHGHGSFRRDDHLSVENGLEEEKPKFNPKTQIQIKDANVSEQLHQIGDEIRTPLEVPEDYGRMAAQTAKQVIIQKLREAERHVQYAEFKEREGELVVGTVQRQEGNRLLIDFGNVTGVLPIDYQIRGERYPFGSRISVLILSVEDSPKGPQIILSRTHEGFLLNLFKMEIPEIASGVVEIKVIAREPGSRSKVAVYTADENIDPIGSCVGQRGSRIQTIIHELGGEKVDIIEWDENPARFLGHAISPAKTDHIDINESKKSAIIYVPADQLSLAIGKSGQNVRLAVKLTGWDINIREVAVAPVAVDKDSVKDTNDIVDEKVVVEGEDGNLNSQE